jgi:FkbM family methyltransferase
MTVLDLGAHHGLYSLLASKNVCPNGQVFAFEPSDRERRALRLHLLMNRCANVSVEGLALGSADAETDFYVTQGRSTGCNSLRHPAKDISGKARKRRVRTTRLDEWLTSSGVRRVDFVKLDVEGGELETLKGAGDMLWEEFRPVMLIEVQDIRTRPWGYEAREIVRYLKTRRFEWFALSESGSIHPMDTDKDEYDGNFVACPAESVSMLRSILDV